MRMADFSTTTVSTGIAGGALVAAGFSLAAVSCRAYVKAPIPAAMAAAPSRT
jgi:hypothetical protein